MDQEKGGVDQEKASGLLRNFLLMTVCFSINHGAAVALVGLATTNLGLELGNLQNALLYGFYTASALLLGNVTVAACGSKWALLTGLWIYVLYVASFVVADQYSHNDAVKYPAACLGGVLGGVAAGGFLWTAQGVYMVQNAKLYAQAAGITDTDAIFMFAGYFAVPFLICEVLFKLMQSYVGESSGNGSAGWREGDDAIFVINTVCAALAAAAGTCIDDLDSLWAATCIDDQDQRAAAKRTFWAPAMDAIVLLLKNPRMACLMWLNITFGVCSSYMNSYVTSVPVPYFVGKGMGGYMSAVTAAAAATFSLLLLFGAEQSSKRITMVVGPAAFMAMAILPLAAGFNALGSWEGMVWVFIFQGVGRGVWEGTNRAVFMDHFPDPSDTPAVYANITLQYGLASTICFMVNAYGGNEPKQVDCSCNDPSDYVEGSNDGCSDGYCPVYSSMATACVVTAALAFVGYWGAVVMDASGINRWRGDVCGVPSPENVYLASDTWVAGKEGSDAEDGPLLRPGANGDDGK